MTKEEILDQYRDDSKFPNINEVVFKQRDVIEAMSEYASQCTAPLEARIRELEEGLREWPGMIEDDLLGDYDIVLKIDNLLSSHGTTPNNTNTI